MIYALWFSLLVGGSAAHATAGLDDNVHVNVAEGMPALCIAALPNAKRPPKGEREDVVAARLLIQAGERFPATAALRKLKPVPTVQAARAVARLLDRDVLGAAALLDPLIEAHPKDGCLLRTGALLAAMSDQRELAVQRARLAAELEPDELDAAVLYGVLLAEVDAPAARDQLRAATERFTTSPMPALHLGSVALDLGDFDTGWWALQQAVDRGMEGLGPKLASMALASGDRARYLKMALEASAPLAIAPGLADASDPWAAYLSALGLAEGEQLTATFDTSLGTIRCALLHETAPVTVANFVGLATGQQPWTHPAGRAGDGPLYNGTIFHRVIPNFMIQGGDPLGDGRGGPGYRFADEIDDTLHFDRPGLLAMANSGPATNGSQWFITDGPAAHLDGRHTIFGVCDAESLPVVAQIARVPADSNDRPVTPVTLNQLTIAAPSAAPAAPETPDAVE